MKSSRYFPLSLALIPKAGLILLLGYAISATTPPAAAQEGEPVAVTLASKKIITQDGHEKLAPANTARPGDVLEYDALYTNQSARSVTNLLAMIPIPEGVEFADSIQPQKAQASLDGKTFEAIPLMRKVTSPDGTTSSAQVPFCEYRAVRWTIPTLTPGEKIKVSLRTRVLTNAAAK